MVNDTPKSYAIIMGVDINAAIGNSSTENGTNSDFGSHGNTHRKERGEMV